MHLADIVGVGVRAGNGVLGEHSSIGPDCTREEIGVVAVCGIQVQDLRAAVGQLHEADDFARFAQLIA